MPQQIIAKELESELMLYETEKDSVHLLNPTARLVYDLYKKGKDLMEIEQEMQKNFQVDDSHDLRGDLLRCLEELRSKKLISIVPQSPLYSGPI
jgi:tRNA pseudouridine-54 N-methylase